MQASYQLGYFPKSWKKENRIYLKKPDKSSHQVPNSYRLISLTNTVDKIFERVILQEAVNTLTENNFFDGKKCICVPEKQMRSPSPTSTYRTNV